MITVTLNSKIQRVGNRVFNFTELLNLSPQMLLEAIKKNNNLVVDKECSELLRAQTRYHGICMTIVSISLRRQENEEKRKGEFIGTFSDNLKTSWEGQYYFGHLRYGV